MVQLRLLCFFYIFCCLFVLFSITFILLICIQRSKIVTQPTFEFFFILNKNILIPLKKTDVTIELVEELQLKTKEYLQPNPTARAKMIAVKGISKLSGQAKSNTYPQPEGILADCMLMYGKKLGDEGPFGRFFF